MVKGERQSAAGVLPLEERENAGGSTLRLILADSRQTTRLPREIPKKLSAHYHPAQKGSTTARKRLLGNGPLQGQLEGVGAEKKFPKRVKKDTRFGESIYVLEAGSCKS